MLTNPKYPSLLYDPSNGTFYRSSTDGSRNLLIIPCDDLGSIRYRCPILGKIIAKKGLNLAYELMYGQIPLDHVIYPRDLNVVNLKAYNVGCVKKTTYVAIKDALKNTNGAIRLLPHKTDAYVYLLKYRNGGRVKTITVHDIVEGLKLKRKIMLKSLKIIEKYIVNN